MSPLLMHVPPRSMGEVWPHIRDAIAAIAAEPGEDWLPEHMFHEIMAGGTYLFTTPDYHAFLVTQILVSPYSRKLHVWVASNDWGGRREDFFWQLNSIAKENDCDTITWVSDRAGWQRVFPDVRAATLYSYLVGE